MNFCTRCASYYNTPGTCNCYAVVRLYPAPTLPQPFLPWQPPYGGPADPVPNPYIVWSGDTCGGSDVDHGSFGGSVGV